MSPGSTSRAGGISSCQRLCPVPGSSACVRAGSIARWCVLAAIAPLLSLSAMLFRRGGSVHLLEDGVKVAPYIPALVLHTRSPDNPLLREGEARELTSE